MVLQAAVDVFYEEGYSGATMRQIVAQADAQMSSVYYHFASKEQLLLEIMTSTLRDSTQFLESRLEDENPQDTVSRLRCVLSAHVAWHTTRQREAFIADSELDRLEPVNRALVVELRDHQETMVRSIIETGVGEGSLRTADPATITRLLLSACTGVARWYRPEGPLDASAIAALLFDAVIDGMGVA